MSAEDNKALVRDSFDEVFSKGRLEAVDKFFSANYVNHTPFPGQVPGPEGVKRSASLLRTAFPDFQVFIDDLIAEQDKVAVRVTERGTHKGEYMGIKPTGKQVTVTGIDIFRVSGGKFVEGWLCGVQEGILKQLGSS